MVSDLRYGINLPKSDVLQFVSADNTIVSVRPSGTEPKIKFYFGVKSAVLSPDSFEDTDNQLSRKIEILIDQMLSYKIS
jgi:phosphoglucomutase